MVAAHLLRICAISFTGYQRNSTQDKARHAGNRDRAEGNKI